jgi:biopolymer transport protein ExbD
MPCARLAAVLSLLLGATLAQTSPSSAPKRSLAEGLTRQWIELHKFVPLHLESGLELGAGQGPLVLLVRHADGKCELAEIERGLGDHGPAAEKQLVELEAVEEEVVEEKVIEQEVPESPIPKPPQPSPAKQQEPAPVSPPPVVAAPTLQLQKTGDQIRLAEAKGAILGNGDKLDRAALKPALERLFARTQGSKFVGQMLLEIDPGVPMQDVLTCIEVARSAGFLRILFSNRRGLAPLSPEVRELVATLPAKQGWITKPFGRGGAAKFREGELLILLEGSACWGDFAPLYVQCAYAGIWQISLVGQKDLRTRFKLPVNLPFDGGF